MATKYTATLSNGTTVKRTSQSGRIYTHFWTWMPVDAEKAAADERFGEGFAGSRDLAEKAGNAFAPASVSAREAKFMNKQEREAYAARLAARRASHRLEIVEVTRIS